MDTMAGKKRTDYCGTFTAKDIGRKVTVTGWVQRQRDLGALIFIDLRDRTGIVQLAFDDTTDKEIFVKTKTFGAGIFFLLFFCIGLYINNFAFYFSFKILTSLSFVITGFLSFYANKEKSEEYTKFAKTILTGLVLSFFADVLLDLFFEIGFGFFFIAEITYFIALFKINKPTKKYWIAITILFFAFFFFEYFNPWTNLGILFWPLMVYLFFLISNTVISAKQFKSESKVTKFLHFGYI